MYVVLDTNIWVRHLGLNSEAGSAIRLFLKQNSGVIAIPEVIRLETQTHIKTSLKKFVEKIDENHSQLLTIFGKLKEISLPTDEEIEDIATNIFQNLEVPTKQIPFSEKSARSSFKKIIEELPPSDRNQQFKDGVIWADCLDLLEYGEVHFVTKDKTFFKGHDYKQGLAKNLQSDLIDKPNELKIHSSLDTLLKILRVNIEINPNNLLKNYLIKHEINISEMLKNFSFRIGDLKSQKIKAFGTNSPESLYVEFEMEIGCKPLKDGKNSEGKLIVKGDAKYNPSEGSFDEIRRLGEEIEFLNSEGKQEKRESAIMHIGGAVIGHKTIEHQIMYELN